jgi:alpha-beta hydrolase superfamily lysophospholipase
MLTYQDKQMRNPDKPEVSQINEGKLITVRDGCKLFVYDYKPAESYHSTLFIISGITGINHHNEKDLIEKLSDETNRVVVIHPRGTGYSEGKRGDIADFQDFINDYVEIIANHTDYISGHKIMLYGHSMSTAVLLAVADKLCNIKGAILVNPPFIQKKAKGMSPGFWQYVRFAFYFLLAKHTPVVNMAGEPSKIENPDDRDESEQKNKHGEDRDSYGASFNVGIS